MKREEVEGSSVHLSRKGEGGGGEAGAGMRKGRRYEGRWGGRGGEG